MIITLDQLKILLQNIAEAIEQSHHLDASYYEQFIQDPELGVALVDIIATMDESEADEMTPLFSATVFAFEICISQLQAAVESNNKVAKKLLDKLMAHMAGTMSESKLSLGFWLPAISAFYEVHAELSDELKEAYFELASLEESHNVADESDHTDTVRNLILELSDLSSFDIAENFFAQSYALPPEFFSDLILDLYSVEEGQEIAVLTLLHPKLEVRDIVVATFNAIIEQITLSPLSLTRLKTIKTWYPMTYHADFDRWIKIQRKKGVVFYNQKPVMPTLTIKASEIDGSGAQGLFLHLKYKEKDQFCGILIKEDIGIKDAWFTPALPSDEVGRYYDDSFENVVMLKEVDLDYLQLFTNHFLYLSLEYNEMPDLHLLEIQEALNLQFVPQPLDIYFWLEKLSVEVNPFTPDRLHQALKQSKGWSLNKRFTESWYMESSQIDSIVNQYSSFIDGTRVCDFDKAMDQVFADVLEMQREHWIFHFIWVALWLKVKARSNERTWQDCVLIAHVINEGLSLKEIPVMYEICRQTVVYSVETMNERRTHLVRKA